MRTEEELFEMLKAKRELFKRLREERDVETRANIRCMIIFVNTRINELKDRRNNPAYL